MNIWRQIEETFQIIINFTAPKSANKQPVNSDFTPEKGFRLFASVEAEGEYLG